MGDEKAKFCSELSCRSEVRRPVCGMREENGLVRLRLFDSECDLMMHGCSVEDHEAFGIIKLDYCAQLFPNNSSKTKLTKSSILLKGEHLICSNNCVTASDSLEVCGLRQDGTGFRIRIFQNKCELLKYNCMNLLNFHQTDMYVCRGLDGPNNGNELIRDDELNDHEFKRNIDTETVQTELDFIETTTEDIRTTEILESTSDVPTEKDIDEIEPFKLINVDNETEISDNEFSARRDIRDVKKAVVLLDGSMLDYNGDINETMDKFIASTHLFDLPVVDVQQDSTVNESFRRMMVKNLRGVVVFKPWTVKPANVNTDMYHQPTLSSCYHKCPMQCPDTYAPVCGIPGRMAREPSIMFQNHCFMDVAQCKMRWEDKSSTSESSTYIESAFVMCLGDSMSALYRFLPLVRTLQHMGRIKKKGSFHYKIRNYGHINNNLQRQPKIMG